MNCKIKKKLGSGFNGTVYLSEIDGKPAISKVEKYDGDSSSRSTYIREIAFSEVARKYPDYFLTLVFHGVIDNCKHVQEKPDMRMNKRQLKVFNEKNKLPSCSMLSYTPVLDGTLGNVMDVLNEKEFYQMVLRIVETCKILEVMGYRHRDIHQGNIMYRMKKGKYQWYLIDYGACYHANFTKNKTDKFLDENPNDMLMLLWMIIDNYAMLYIRRNKLPLVSYDTMIKRIKKSADYKVIKQLVPTVESGKFRKATTDECIGLITAIVNYPLYAQAIGVTEEQWKSVEAEIKSKNKGKIDAAKKAKVLLYIVQHYNDIGLVCSKLHKVINAL